MEKLWKKEGKSGAGDSLYVNLFANPHNNEDYREWDDQLNEDFWKHAFSDVMTVWPTKSNETSSRFRSMGNSAYMNSSVSLNQRLYAAMELYNESLRYAEIGTENLGLAYANRSACFLGLQMYEKCLIDIDKAKKANYPSKLMAKLNAREAHCKELQQTVMETEQLNEEPKLDFPADKNFPSMANVVRITRNDEFGRLLEAKCDIEVGKTILVDDAFVSVSTRTGTFCFTCLKRHQSFIPCTQCTDVVFCSIDCMNESHVHKISCGALYHRMPVSLKLPLQSILIAINTFPTVEELMDFVESNLKQNSDNDLPTSLLDARQKYAFFLTLKMLHNPTYDFTLRAYQIYTSAMAIPAIQKLFDVERKRRFLMHLVMQHILIVHTNAFNAPNTELPFDLASMACVLSLANHSCTPNLCNFGVANQEVCVTIRPIRKGEQLFISYVEEDETTPQRQSTLQQNYGFECKCERCTRSTGVLTKQHYEMLMDPCFQLLLYPDATNLPGDDVAKCMERREMCRKFLRKFAHLKYSDAYDEVVKEFKRLLIVDQISDDNLTALPTEH